MGHERREGGRMNESDGDKAPFSSLAELGIFRGIKLYLLYTG